MRRALVATGCAWALVACGSTGTSAPRATSASSAAPATTAPTRTAALEVRPPSGPLGTSFQVLGTRFQPGEAVTFEVHSPDGKTSRRSQAYTATRHGNMLATLQIKPGLPIGTYQVDATGDKGTRATGRFEVTAGVATTAPGPDAASTTPP